jgi:hypothetical protein
MVGRILRIARTSLVCSFLFVLAVNLLPEIFLHPFVAYAGFLLIPGIWIAYDILEGSVHDLSPFIIMQLVNILFYWIIFALLLALRRKGTRESREQARQS